MAYIGPIEEAEEFNIDNKFIRRGYRINHRKCSSLCKSLFKCHNEFINVWSHICGVLVFIALMTAVSIEVLPNQFWYAKKLDSQFKQVLAEGPETFIDAKIVDLLAMQSSL